MEPCADVVLELVCFSRDMSQAMHMQCTVHLCQLLTGLYMVL